MIYRREFQQGNELHKCIMDLSAPHGHLETKVLNLSAESAFLTFLDTIDPRNCYGTERYRNTHNKAITFATTYRAEE
jgi:hypothetical protein